MNNKILVIYSGHQYDYLYGLITALSINNNKKVLILDSLRPKEQIFDNVANHVIVKPIIDKRDSSILRFFDILLYYFKIVYHTTIYRPDIIHIEWLNYGALSFEEILYSFIVSIVVIQGPIEVAKSFPFAGPRFSFISCI